MTYIKIQRSTDDGEEPKYAVEPPDVAVEPFRLPVDERLEEEVEHVDRGERESV